jgi:intracellular septation protein A
MKNLFHAGKFLLIDMASTIFFLAVFTLTKNVVLSVALGMALGIAEIVWERSHGKRIETMQWLSLFLVLAAGAATFFTRDPRFILIKPSIIYLIVATVMLKPGWMNRYLPERAMQIVPDVGVKFGFVWSALMVFTAILNIYVAFHYSLAAWAAFMSAWALGSKLTLFLIQYATMRLIGGYRVRTGQVVLEEGAQPV